MRKLFNFIFFVTLTANVSSQGIDFYEGQWEEALELAQQEDKIVFIDAYAEWCGPCKMMARTVFVDPDVGKFYNENFISMQIDMEKGQGIQFRQKYPVSAFPTLLYLKPDGEVIHKTVGAKSSQDFVKLGKLAIRKYDRSAEFAVEYEKGNREFDLVLNYVKSLIKAEKPSLKISNDYLKSNPSITAEEKAEFIFEATTEADSRIFNLMIEQKSILSTIYSESKVQDKIKSACEKTVQKAVEFESYMLVEESKKAMKTHFKSEAKTFDIEADMVYAKGIGDMPAYFNSVNDYCKKIINKDPEELHNYANLLLNSYKDRKEALDLGESLCENALKQEEKIDYLLTYSKILVSNGKKDQALDNAWKAREMTRLEGKPTRQIDGLIRFIESQ